MATIQTSCEKIAECCFKGDHSLFERFPNEVLTSNQITIKGEKLEGNARIPVALARGVAQLLSDVTWEGCYEM